MKVFSGGISKIACGAEIVGNEAQAARFAEIMEVR
jgi:hypothetical protein